MKKKYKINTEEWFKEVINYMLREYNITYEKLIKNQYINGIPWFQYYWNNRESREEFEKWFKEFIKKECKGTYTERYINRLYSEFDLMYGLIEY